MTRLIDADALKAVFEEKSSEAVCGVELCKAIIFRINKEPTVDAVPVIRCCDCKHFKNHTGKFREQRFRKDGICKYHNYEQVMLDGFCSNAERGNDD